MKQVLALSLLACIGLFSAKAQNLPKWQWAVSDTTTSIGVNPGYLKPVVAAGRNKVMWGSLISKKATQNPSAYGNYKISEMDSAGKVITSTQIDGKVALLDAQADSSGNWYILGQIFDTVTFSGGYTRVLSGFQDAAFFICRLDAGTLNLNWFKSIGNNSNSTCNNLYVKNSSLYIAVDTYGKNVVYKYDVSNGNSTRLIAQSGAGRFSSMVVDDNDNIYVAGSCPGIGTADFNGKPITITSPYQSYIIRYDAGTGQYNWSMFMHDITCVNRKLTLNYNGSICYSGGVNDTMTIGSYKVSKPWTMFGANFILANIENTGTVNWVRQVKDTIAGTANLEANYNAVAGPDSTIIIIPQVRNYIDWGNGFSSFTGTKQHTAIVAYKMDGSIKWLKHAAADLASVIHITANKQDIWVAGNTRDTSSVDFDNISAPATLNGYAPFIAKLHVVDAVKGVDTTIDTPTYIQQILVNDCHIVPNPATHYVRITGLAQIKGDITINVLDITGRNIYHAAYTNTANLAEINVAGFARGLYIVELTSGKNRVMKKLLLQ